jgi:hypothetical protein
MVERFTSTFRRRDGDAQVLFDLFLADEITKTARSKAGVKRRIFSAGFT